MSERKKGDERDRNRVLVTGWKVGILYGSEFEYGIRGGYKIF